MRALAAVALFATVVAAQTEREPIHSVTAVRHWSQGNVTRVAVEVSGAFVFRGDRLHAPERVYFDILRSVPHIDGRRSYTELLQEPLLKRVRVAETSPGITRVVLDVADGVEVHSSQLVNPNRLIIELRIGSESTPTTPSFPPSTATEAPQLPKLAPPPSIRTAVSAKADAVERVTAPPSTVASVPAISSSTAVPKKPVLTATATESTTAKPVTAAPATSPGVSSVEPAAPPKAARHTASGETSLVRALGLKMQRIVIDPGHGGHDQGTEGPHGLLEKDVVLDVSQRLGKLIEDRMGAEVIYTRTDDTFVPLRSRTDLANEKKADLFLSIHANSSPARSVTGVETYYLSLTDQREAADVAARENATSQLSIFDMQDLVKKIVTTKIEESKEFAGCIQSALWGLSKRTFPDERSRGVKKAPLLVLVGVQIPSVLAEIGFLSNPREEALLRRPEYRQKVAEALYKGVSRYSESLSHFQVAQNGSK